MIRVKRFRLCTASEPEQGWIIFWRWRTSLIEIEGGTHYAVVIQTIAFTLEAYQGGQGCVVEFLTLVDHHKRGLGHGTSTLTYQSLQLGGLAGAGALWRVFGVAT